MRSAWKWYRQRALNTMDALAIERASKAYPDWLNNIFGQGSQAFHASSPATSRKSSTTYTVYYTGLVVEDGVGSINDQQL